MTQAYDTMTATRIAADARVQAEHLANEAIGRGSVAVNLSATASGHVAVSTAHGHADVRVIFDADGAAYTLCFFSETLRGRPHTLAAALRKRFAIYALRTCPATVRRWESA